MMSPLTEIIDQNVKNNLITKVPNTAVGLTSVGGGLQLALNVRNMTPTLTIVVNFIQFSKLEIVSIRIRYFLELG